jgi:RHS repeat-associated protein
VGCGGPWLQTFTYDVFGNINKSGSVSFQPSYDLATNHYVTLPNGTPTYDANGNLLTDGFHTYNWDAEGRMQHVDFGNSTWTFDALGRWVDKTSTGSPVQAVYTPQGSLLALMAGQSFQEARLPLVGGTAARYRTGTTGPVSYWSPDWLGSSRLESSPTRTVLVDAAFAPFGEQYVYTSSFDSFFTGAAPQDKTSDLRDFPAREYHPTQGRWISPDPAGLAAVDITDPQTWNRYAYVRNNPTGLVDPTGLDGECGPGVSLPCTVTGTDIAPSSGADSFMYQIYFGWYCGVLGICNQPSHGGGGPSTTGTPTSPKKTGPQLAHCAADFGNNFSIAAGLDAITGGGVSRNNFAVSALFGNDVSAISDIFTGRNPLSAGIGEFFSNPSPWNVVSLGTRAVGSLPSGGASTATLGENSAGQAFVRTWNPAKVAGTAAFKLGSKALAVYTLAKFAWDLGTFAVGTAVCQQQP